MKGLELAREFYEEYGKAAFEEAFGEDVKQLAFGLCGSGSECMGWDDEISSDHDMEPGFCVFLPGEDRVDRHLAFKMERVYASLPREFRGLKRSLFGPAGEQRHGVLRMEEFFLAKTGFANGMPNKAAWFTLPEQSLMEAVSGCVWRDDSGVFSAVRSQLRYFPEDVRLKKLAGELMQMSSTGQYNYERCVSRDDNGAAQLCIQEYVRSAMHVYFLLNERYMPYYKWRFRALRELGEKGLQAAERFESLICRSNRGEDFEEKLYTMADIVESIVEMLQDRDLTQVSCCDLKQHALSVNDRVKDPDIRNWDLLAGV